jgi:hypothetical protein
MQVSIKVAGTSLETLNTAADAALAAFFGETPYTYNMGYIQADNDSFDTDGLPTRYQADIQASTDV